MTTYDIEFISNVVGYTNIDNNVFDEFLIEYNKIINSENTIPIFNNESKFHSNKNKRLSKKKYNTQCIFIRNSNAWTPKSNIDLEKNITNSIKSNLNKLSSINSNTIIDTLIKDIHCCNTPNITNILCDEIIRKNIYDKDYQDEYVKLCIRICNEDFKNNIIIIKSNNKYYWEKNDNYIGPYNTIDKLKSFYNKILSFKRVLINKLYDIFINRYSIYSKIDKETDDEKRFKLKREIVSITEFVCKLYDNGLIGFEIIYIIHLYILDLNKEKSYINYDIEILYGMWNILLKIQNNKILRNEKQINIIYNKIKYELTKIELTYRIQFFVNNLIENLENKFNTFLKDNKFNENYKIKDESKDESEYESEYEDEDEIEDIIINNINKNTLNKYILSKENDIMEYLDTLIYITLNNSKYNMATINCIRDCLDKGCINNNDIKELLSHTDEDIEEMVLDNYKVKDNFVELKSLFNSKFEM